MPESFLQRIGRSGLAGRFVSGVCCALLAAFGLAPSARAGESPLQTATGAVRSMAADGAASLEKYLEGLEPLMVHTATPVLSALIERSRDEAIAQGVEPIPNAIRAELAGYVPEATLDRVRWCVACGGPLSLQRNTFLFRYAPAITLDYVVVFEHRGDALGDPSLWAHELKHVMQYREWGVEGFAARYLADYQAVESEAAEYRWQWMKRTHYLERRAARRRGRAAPNKQ
ncbi:MAG TPA: DUF4157 domain-containing protein [Gammaproteobacteria bacterium]|nr:DUF4157 domain-containing protein [Gammaproteobacteria bacterium]